MKCGKECEVYSRVVGYCRPVKGWNLGKKEEWKERTAFSEKRAMQHETRIDFKSVPNESGEYFY
jgi:hypothetical protein